MIIRKKEVAKMLGVSIGTVDNMTVKGILPQPFSISDRAIGWDKRDIEAWIDNRKNKGNKK